MRELLTNWSIMRVIRLILGVFVLVQGVNTGEVLFMVTGGLIALMALAGTGCCGANGCAVDSRRTAVKEEMEIVYEEVGGTK